jgi:hypothetical protein
MRRANQIQKRTRRVLMALAVGLIALLAPMSHAPAPDAAAAAQSAD